MLNIFRPKFFTTGRAKTVVAIIVIIISSPLFATWGPDSANYKEEAPLVGTWIGQISGKPIEFAIWPNGESDMLSGVMVWGDCSAGVHIKKFNGATKNNSPAGKETSKTTDHLYSFSSFLLDNKELGGGCPGAESPGAERPGYSELYLQSDEKTEKLTTLKKSTTATLVKEEKTLSRGTPSRFLVAAIEYLANSGDQFKLTSRARISIFNANKNFLTESTLLDNTSLTNIENYYYVSEFGGIYRVDDINEGNAGQYYFYLNVINLGPHHSRLLFAAGEKGGSGEFNPETQSISLSLFDQSEQCGIIRKPLNVAKITPEIRSPLTVENQANANIIWVLASKGACTAYQFYDGCNPGKCNRWFRDQIKNPNIKAILTKDIEIAETQAKTNSASITRQ